jgi:Cu/Ag efflux protein CusF
VTARALGMVVLSFAILGAVRGPVAAPYEVVLYGTIRAIDVRDRLVTIAYAPLDTAPGGVRKMRVRSTAMLEGLLPGDPIQAIADTRHRRWVIRDLHRLQ